MTLHDIENALPPCIRFIHEEGAKAGVLVDAVYMGMIYDTADGLYYNLQCMQNDSDDVARKNTFLSYFNYGLVLNLQYFKCIYHYLLYKLEPKFRVVYK